jgi:KaiC/GvpD/RAD55 family RecA-like ATPase
VGVADYSDDDPFGLRADQPPADHPAVETPPNEGGDNHFMPDNVYLITADKPTLLTSTSNLYPLIWYGEIEPLLDGAWVIKNVIPAEGFVTIIGHPGCGKSFLALDLALHIAAGRNWQGRKIKKQGCVVYLAAEGQRGQMNRVIAWRRHHGAENLPFALIPVAMNLRDSAADLPKLIATIQAALDDQGLELSVLIIDTLNRTFGGGDENGEDMSAYVNNTGRLRQHFSCTTIIVHHVPKNSETLTERGHGSLRGAIDTSLAVEVDDQSKVRTCRCIKQKDGEDGWDFQFKLHSVELGHDEDGDPVSSCVIEAADDDMAGARSFTGPSLTGVQRQVYQELLATIEGCGVPIPRDLPDGLIDTYKVGKVASVKQWKARWIAVAGTEYNPDTAAATFRRAKTDLQNKRLIGVWNDHAWATFQ